MNITRLSKSKSEIISPSKLIISVNYQENELYHILNNNPKLVNIKDKNNETFLSYAIKRKNESICKLIIISPLLDLTYKDSKGNSYLHLSVINELMTIIELLLEKGININSQNDEGNTALHYAYNNYNIKIISLLIKNNAELDIENNQGLTPEKIRKNSLNSDININSSFNDYLNKSSYYNNFDKNLSIQLKNNNENNFNNTNNTKLNDTNKNSFKCSIVNFSYSEDENEENKNSNLNELKNKEDISDIFNLTSSITYKEKMRDVSNINSHTIGERHNIILDNKNNINNKSKNDNGFFEYSTSISKEEKDLLIQKPYLSNNINMFTSKNLKSYDKNNIEPDFIFSPFTTIKESPNEQINYNFNLNNINKIDIKDKYNDSLYIFLSEINLEKQYYNIMNSNGFEDIQFLIEQEKLINNSNISNNKTSITNSDLKEIGILLPGDRAKILIHLEEKAGNYNFQIPKSVYYNCDNFSDIMNDINIKKIYNWLKAIKVENYLENFIEGGYYSIELILMQMNSKNPISDFIIKDELGIKKVGHRARIMNKLAEDAKKFLNKLKGKEIIVANGEIDDNCRCNAF